MTNPTLIERLLKRLELHRAGEALSGYRTYIEVSPNDLESLITDNKRLCEALTGALKVIEGDGLTYPRKWDEALKDTTNG